MNQNQIHEFNSSAVKSEHARYFAVHRLDKNWNLTRLMNSLVNTAAESGSVILCICYYRLYIF